MINRDYITVKVNGNAINEGACGKYGYQVVSAGRDPEFVVAAGDTSVGHCFGSYGCLYGHQGYIYAIPT